MSKKSKSNYKRIAKNLYRDGNSYRVIMSIRGERYSMNFQSLRAAKNDLTALRKAYR